MATTYTTSNTPLNRARRLLGDTGIDGNTFLVLDEEIANELTAYSFNEAVALLADGLAVRFAQYPDETTTPGGHKLKWSERVQAWKDLADRLRAAPGPGTRSAVAHLGTLSNPAAPSTGVRGLR
jgi:hypothetical protein